MAKSSSTVCTIFYMFFGEIKLEPKCSLGNIIRMTAKLVLWEIPHWKDFALDYFKNVKLCYQPKITNSIKCILEETNLFLWVRVRSPGIKHFLKKQTKKGHGQILYQIYFPTVNLRYLYLKHFYLTTELSKINQKKVLQYFFNIYLRLVGIYF